MTTNIREELFYLNFLSDSDKISNELIEYSEKLFYNS